MIPVSAGFKSKFESGISNRKFEVDLYLPREITTVTVPSVDSVDFPGSAINDGDRSHLNSGPAAGAENLIGRGMWKGQPIGPTTISRSSRRDWEGLPYTTSSYRTLARSLSGGAGTSCVGYWRMSGFNFNEPYDGIAPGGQPGTHYSDAPFNGTTIGSKWLGQAGMLAGDDDGAAGFNHLSAMSVPTYSAMTTLTQKFSAAFLFKCPTHPAVTTTSVLFRDDGNHYWHVDVAPGGDVTFSVRYGTGVGPAGQEIQSITSAGVNVLDGALHHIAVIYGKSIPGFSGIAIEVYIDGILRGVLFDTVHTLLAPFAAPLVVQGVKGNSLNRTVIDEVSMWDYPLKGGEFANPISEVFQLSQMAFNGTPVTPDATTVTGTEVVGGQVELAYPAPNYEPEFDNGYTNQQLPSCGSTGGTISPFDSLWSELTNSDGGGRYILQSSQMPGGHTGKALRMFGDNTLGSGIPVTLTLGKSVPARTTGIVSFWMMSDSAVKVRTFEAWEGSPTNLRGFKVTLDSDGLVKLSLNPASVGTALQKWSWNPNIWYRFTVVFDNVSGIVRLYMGSFGFSGDSPSILSTVEVQINTGLALTTGINQIRVSGGVSYPARGSAPIENHYWAEIRYGGLPATTGAFEAVVNLGGIPSGSATFSFTTGINRVRNIVAGGANPLSANDTAVPIGVLGQSFILDQTFTPTVNLMATYARLEMGKVGVPTGVTAIVTITTMAGTVLAGGSVALPSSARQAIDVSWDLSSPAQLVAGTQYRMVLTLTASGTYNTGNYYTVWKAAADVYAGGQAEQFTGGIWVALGGDLGFEVLNGWESLASRAIEYCTFDIAYSDAAAGPYSSYVPLFANASRIQAQSFISFTPDQRSYAKIRVNFIKNDFSLQSELQPITPVLTDFSMTFSKIRPRVVADTNGKTFGRVILTTHPIEGGLKVFKLQHAVSAAGPWIDIASSEIARILALEKYNGHSVVALDTPAAPYLTVTATGSPVASVPSTVIVDFKTNYTGVFGLVIDDSGTGDLKPRLTEIELYSRDDITSRVSSFELNHETDSILENTTAREGTIEVKNPFLQYRTSDFRRPLTGQLAVDRTAEVVVFMGIDTELLQVAWLAVDEPNIDQVTKTMTLKGRGRHDRLLFKKNPASYHTNITISDAVALEMALCNVPQSFFALSSSTIVLPVFGPENKGWDECTKLKQAMDDPGVVFDGEGLMRDFKHEPFTIMETIPQRIALGFSQIVSEELSGKDSNGQLIVVTHTLAGTPATTVYAESPATAGTPEKMVKTTLVVDPTTLSTGGSVIEITRFHARFPKVRNSLATGILRGTAKTDTPVSVVYTQDGANSDDPNALSRDTIDNEYVVTTPQAAAVADRRFTRTAQGIFWCGGELPCAPHLEIGDNLRLAITAREGNFDGSLKKVTHTGRVENDRAELRTSVDIVAAS